MKPSDFQKTVMCRFDSCLKKTVFGVVKDYYKELKKNQAEAIPFCELPDIIIDKVAIWDTYKTDYTTFNICGHDIYVYDDELAKVIKLILSILVYTLFSRMFDLMQPPAVKHSIAVV